MSWPLIVPIFRIDMEGKANLLHILGCQSAVQSGGYSVQEGFCHRWSIRRANLSENNSDDRFCVPPLDVSFPDGVRQSRNNSIEGCSSRSPSNQFAWVKKHQHKTQAGAFRSLAL